MNFLIKSFCVFLFIIFPLSSFGQIQTQSESTDVNLIVEGCNNNSVCEANIGEDINSCPLDCPLIVIPPVEPENDDSDRSGRSGGRINIFEPDSQSNVSYYQDVMDLRVTVQNKEVFLSWNNPDLLNFDYVRIMKNNSYTDSPYDGELVYEGDLESFLDSIEIFNRNYYYNFFARYDDGQFSKGVGFVVSAREPSIVEDVNGLVDDVIFREEDKKDIFFNAKFSIYDIVFIQDLKKLRWKRDTLQAISNNPISVSLPKKDFFGEIEDIYLYVDLYRTNGKFFRRDILKLDYFASNQTYNTNIIDLQDVKKADFRLSVMKGSNEESFVTGSINFDQKIQQKEEKFNIIFWIFLIIIIFILMLFFKQKKSNK